jgi:hypothetical protein
LERKNMMAANYLHVGSLENGLGRHYGTTALQRFRLPRPLLINYLRRKNCATAGRIGEVGLGPGRAG